jgi:hypothetical protein
MRSNHECEGRGQMRAMQWRMLGLQEPMTAAGGAGVAGAAETPYPAPGRSDAAFTDRSLAGNCRRFKNLKRGLASFSSERIF